MDPEKFTATAPPEPFCPKLSITVSFELTIVFSKMPLPLAQQTPPGLPIDVATTPATGDDDDVFSADEEPPRAMLTAGPTLTVTLPPFPPLPAVYVVLLPVWTENAPAEPPTDDAITPPV
jgi:hypothetical protein